MCKIFIWGTGVWGEKCFQDILPEVNIIGFVESRASREYFHGKRVISGEELTEYEYDYLVLANTHENQIIQDFCLDRQRVLCYRQMPKSNVIKLFRYQLIDCVREMMPYLSVECDELTFLYNRTDIMIPDNMRFYRKRLI